MPDNKNKYEDEELITDSGSTIAQVGDEFRGRRGAESGRNGDDEELITDSGSTIAQVGDEFRGRRGVESGRNGDDEELITDSGSTIAQVGDEFRGRRGAESGRNGDDEELITDSGSTIAQVGDEFRGRRGAETRMKYNAPVTESKNEFFQRPSGEFLDIMVINGESYRIVRTISDSTAEARVIQLEKQGENFALKLYYPDSGHHADKRVLQLLKDNEEPGLINLYDFGEMINGLNPSERCDFELMEYCEGGILEPGSLRGRNEDMFYVALGLIYAVSSCENLGIIHRDIKPQNFLWANKEHSRLVLSDFSFAVICERGGEVRVPDHRTIIYTAPEFYLRAPGMLPKISIASEIYSAGIAMLTLWSGEEVMMGMTETQQIEMKTREQLPYPNDMDNRLLELLKGITRARPDQRWDFLKIKTWAKENRNDNFEEPQNREFEILFDTDKDQVAYNRGELAGLMANNQEMAIRLLYSGVIEYWLESAGFFDEAVTLNQITEEKYPGKEQHTAGLWAAIYTIDPSMPYFFPGSDVNNPEKTVVANSIMELTDKIWERVFVKQDSYLKNLIIREINNPYSPLTVYLLWNNKEEELERVRRHTLNPAKAEEGLLLLLYLMNPLLPLYLNGRQANDVDDILIRVSENNMQPFEIFTHEAFVEWLGDQDILLSIKVQEKIKAGGTPMDVYAIIFNEVFKNR